MFEFSDQFCDLIKFVIVVIGQRRIEISFRGLMVNYLVCADCCASIPISESVLPPPLLVMLRRQDASHKT